MAEGTVTEGWLRHTLEEIISQIRALLDVDGCAFRAIDEDRGLIRPAAAWFERRAARREPRARAPVRSRARRRHRGGDRARRARC